MITIKTVQAIRLQRMFLKQEAGRDAYERLFRFMSPVQPVYWSAPGDPPVLPQHAGFADASYTSGLRADRRVLKGRFQSGNIAYVFYEDFALFASAYRSVNVKLSFAETQFLELLKTEGPMNIGTMKEMTGLLVKEITPVLHKLQKKFLVFEDQVDCEGDRAWYLFEEEFSEMQERCVSKKEALLQILPRFVELHVFATLQMMQSFYQFALKDIKAATDTLVETGLLQRVVLAGEEGFLLSADIKEVMKPQTPEPSVYTLHKNDFIVKSHEHWLKHKFEAAPYDVLQYLLIDGAFSGVVAGKFKNGPFLMEDVVVALEEKEARRRKEEILQSIYSVHDVSSRPAKRYQSQPNKE